MSITIYHNPKCSKSRKAIEILEEKKLNFDVIKYLEEGLKKGEILELLKALDSDHRSIIRQKDDYFKQTTPCIDTPEQVAILLESQPKLLQRPIVLYEEKATIARPPEKLVEIL